MNNELITTKHYSMQFSHSRHGISIILVEVYIIFSRRRYPMPIEYANCFITRLIYNSVAILILKKQKEIQIKTRKIHDAAFYVVNCLIVCVTVSVLHLYLVFLITLFNFTLNAQINCFNCYVFISRPNWRLIVRNREHCYKIVNNSKKTGGCLLMKSW